ncbi:MAG: DUF1592 domain-containing protein [Planctomycetota bacterium]
MLTAHPRYSHAALALLGLLTWLPACPSIPAEPTPESAITSAIDRVESFVEANCLDCHSGEDAESGFQLDELALGEALRRDPALARRSWEKLLRRVRSRQMPPADAERPSEDDYRSAVAALEQSLDHAAKLDPGFASPDTLRRLTRTEYQHAVHDLLGVDVDVSEWLPADEVSHGFDNITVGELSPTLLNRYLSAAAKVARLAVARTTGVPEGVTVRIPPDQTQDQHVPGLPLGTRGGTVFRRSFPESGQYEISIRLTRDRDEQIEGLNRDTELDVLVDDQRVHRFVVKPPRKTKDYSLVDASLVTRIPIQAGSREIGVAFPDQGFSLPEIKRQPFDGSYNRHRHPRRQPAIFQISIVGPLDGLIHTRTNTSSGSRKRVLGAALGQPEFDNPAAAAAQVLKPLMRVAFRRPVTGQDLQTPLQVFEEAADRFQPKDGDAAARVMDRSTFEYAIEQAIASVLVNPNFLFRVESSPSTLSGNDPLQPLSHDELASRLSFFLWSSLPDEALIAAAQRPLFTSEESLVRQTRRMMTDPKSERLVDNFVAQWLQLRKLEAVNPDLRRFPDFDNNLRQAMRQETEEVFRDLIRRDGSVLELISSDHTFLNERLAVHYDIPGVQGSRFRQVSLPKDSPRGGLLRHASILTVTSYATRTSPTIRGAWILENLLGTPPPPPPPDVPALKEKQQAQATTVRQRLAQHRSDPACASCHNLMDPVGFALEHYDAVGRYRHFDHEAAVDASATLPDGASVSGVAQLETNLLAHPEVFVTAMTEKLLTFALGRGIDYRDATTVRRIVRQATQDNYRFSSLVEGIVTSPPFLSRWVVHGGPATETLGSLK